MSPSTNRCRDGISHRFRNPPVLPPRRIIPLSVHTAVCPDQGIGPRCYAGGPCTAVGWQELYPPNTHKPHNKNPHTLHYSRGIQDSRSRSGVSTPGLLFSTASSPCWGGTSLFSPPRILSLHISFSFYSLFSTCLLHPLSTSCSRLPLSSPYSPYPYVPFLVFLGESVARC